MTDMVLLGVNIDHVATVRQARGGREPEVLAAARVVARGPADGITVHLREDRRHIQDADVIAIKKQIKTKLNLEMSLAEEIVRFALRLRPEDVCIVPERRREVTTEGGLDVRKEMRRLRRVIPRLQRLGIRVSLFINPDPDMVRLSREAGADCVELHTGSYAEAGTTTSRDRQEAGSAAERQEWQRTADRQYRRLSRAVQAGLDAGLIVNAGHGLNYANTARVAAIPGIHELNIGHSIISRALFTGLPRAIREMHGIISAAAVQSDGKRR